MELIGYLFLLGFAGLCLYGLIRAYSGRPALISRPEQAQSRLWRGLGVAICLAGLAYVLVIVLWFAFRGA